MFEESMKTNHAALARKNEQMIDRWLYFASEKSALDEKTRCMAVLAALLGCQGMDEFERMVPVALDCGVSPVGIQEIVYQATAYLGMGRVSPFYTLLDRIFDARSIQIEDDRQTTMLETRLRQGNDIQIAYFGPQMKNTWEKGGDRARVNEWLASNCFGDYYTRKGLTDSIREMITFCFIMAQGGCENQLRGHTNGNLNVGNSKSFLIAVIEACVPWIGYPRSLNAFAIVEEVCKGEEKK